MSVVSGFFHSVEWPKEQMYIQEIGEMYLSARLAARQLSSPLRASVYCDLIDASRYLSGSLSPSLYGRLIPRWGLVS